MTQTSAPGARIEHHPSIIQASMDAGIAMTLASSRFSSERVATMRRQPGAARVCASRRQRSSTYFDSMAMPPNPGPTKSISFRCPGPSGPEWFASQGRHGGPGAAQLLDLGTGEVAGGQARPGRRHLA